MKIVTVTAPTETAVSVAEARAQCSLLDDNTHDTLLLRLIGAATSAVEAEIRGRLMQQTVRFDFDGFPSGDLELGLYPITAVTALAYDDEDDTEQTLSEGTDFWVSLEGMTPTLVAVSGWPATKSGKPGTLRVTVTAGYTRASSVPDDIRHAILMKVAELFQNREEALVGSVVAPTINSVRHLLAPYRRHVL